MTIRRLSLAAAALGAAAAFVAGMAYADDGGRRSVGTGTIVFQSNRAGGPPELYTMAEDGANVRRLTFNDATDRTPRFSPDGLSVAFASDRDGDLDIYVLDLASGAVMQLTNDPARDDLPVFSADGETVVYQRGDFFCPCALRAVEVDGTNDRALDTGPGNAAFPDMSRRGRKLAFASDRSGIWAIYTMRLDGRRLRQVTHPASGFGDFRPHWSPRAGELVFMGGDAASSNDIYLVRANGTRLRQLTSGPRFEEHANFSPDGRRVIFGVFAPDGGARLYTIGRDGADEQALPQLAAPLAEGFDDSTIDRATWHTIIDPGSSLAESGGRLELAIAADAVPGGQFNQVNAHIGSQCSLPGDYDMQVDFRLLEWPVGGGVYASLNAFFANAGVSRWTNQWGDQFTAWSDRIGNSVPATSARGSFRLARLGATLTAYARAEDGDWITVFSGPAAAGNAVAGIGVTAVGGQFQNVPARVAFDNFRLSLGVLACPSWWRDAGPDWTADLSAGR
jgi:Tol biopolymer transport system component